MNIKFHEFKMNAKSAKINSTRKFVGLQYADLAAIKIVLISSSP